MNQPNINYINKKTNFSYINPLIVDIFKIDNTKYNCFLYLIEKFKTNHDNYNAVLLFVH
jgi:hypothetical protein